MAAQKNKQAFDSAVVAYFSLEVALESAIPTYAGGLGVLAGDTLRAAADLALPMVGVTLLYRKGYFRQQLDAWGNQKENPVEWSPEKFMEPLPAQVSITIEGREVKVQAWRYLVHGHSGHVLPVYFMDTRVPENSAWDQSLTDYLYGGDAHYRLCQEAVLGLGGVAMLKRLGHERVWSYHMNEGHAALLTLALLEEQTEGRGRGHATAADWEAVCRRCVFTTHTPVPAGFDQFPLDLVRRVLGEAYAHDIETAGCCTPGVLNMTHQALFCSRYINGVSMRHEDISKSMFPNYPVNSITNGVHAATWVAQPFARVYDRFVPEWRNDNRYLRYAIGIPLDEIQAAHRQAKQELLAEVKRWTGKHLNPQVMTIGFARRAATYKRADMLFADLGRLQKIAGEAGPVQVIFSGKAHPQDEGGKGLIRRVFEAGAALGDGLPVVYLEAYDMALAKLVCAGADLWLNTPQKPLEASGTSGMKAALNGVPSLSVLDGWWVEGHVEGVTGWSIGDDWGTESSPDKELGSLYSKLEFVILPMFYGRPDAFAWVMRSAITLNGSFFNAQRMVSQYWENAYSLANPK